MARFHNLFLALRPPLPVANRIMELRRSAGLSGQWLPRERLYVSLLSLGKHPVMPLRLIDRVSELLAEEPLPDCRLIFDQLINGRNSAFLGTSTPLQDVERLQARLSGRLASADIVFERWRSIPRITLGYNVRPQPVQAIDPFRWTANELVLIDSLYGESKHLTMARWPLNEERLNDQSQQDRLPTESSFPLAQPVEQQLALFV